MRRREFIAGIGSAAAAGAAMAMPRLVRAQARLPIIGFLYAGSPDGATERAFHQGLAETGYVEGQNVAIEYHWAEGQVERAVALMGELVRDRYAVIVVVGSTPAALALKAATRTIPIVFLIGPDPVAAGLVASLNRPGGNLTGVTVSNVQVIAKRLELLHKLVPAATSIGFLVNPTNAPATEAEINADRCRGSQPALAGTQCKARRPKSNRHWRLFSPSGPARSSSAANRFFPPGAIRRDLLAKRRMRHLTGKAPHCYMGRPAGRGQPIECRCAFFSVAIFEAARFALMRHFLSPEDLFPRQTFCNDVSIFDRQLSVRITR